MSRHTDNLDRLLRKLQARYGEHDAVVSEVRRELLCRQSIPLRDAPPSVPAPEPGALARPVRSPAFASQSLAH